MSLSWSAWRELLRDEVLPCAVVDLDAFDRNVDRVASLVGAGQTLRLATKSLRVPDLIRRALDRGKHFTGLMTYSAAETLALHRLGFDDFLLAYPTARGPELRLIREAHDAGATVALVVDSEAHLAAASRAMEGASRPLRLVADVDMTLLPGTVHAGVRRSPLRSVDAVVQLFERARSFGDVRLVGLMCYDAQIAGLQDRAPGRRVDNLVARAVRSASVPHVARLRRSLRDALVARGHSVELFNGGGSGSLDLCAKEPWLTEVTAGSALLCGHLFDGYSNVAYEPAAFFAAAVARASDPGWVTCAGGGWIASGAAGEDRLPRPWLPEGLSLSPREGMGEVQTPLRLPKGVTLSPGDPVLFRHAKSGEVAEHVDAYLLVAGGGVVGRARTYRGMDRSGPNEAQRA
ncbi:MAG: alanine racemase [Polyangiales bacterium]